MEDIRLKNIIFGICQITAIHGFDNIFLSECQKSKIELTNLTSDNEFLKFEVRFADKELLLKCAEKAAVDIHKIRYKGIPYVFYRYRLRFGIPFGMILSVILISILASMLWSIDYSGNSFITDEKLTAVIDDYGVSIGVFTKCIDSDDLEFFLSEKFKEFSRVSVHIAGCRMFVDVRERENIADINHGNSYSNIIASKNGEIIRADIFEGDGKIESGTPVVKGDLLVGGVINFRDGRVRFTDAKADIWAYTKNHITVMSGTKIDVFVPSDIRNSYSLLFFGLRLPFKNTDKSFTQNRYFFDANSVVFPIGISRQFYCSLTSAKLNLSSEEALLISFCDYAVAVMKLKEKAEIVEAIENVIIDDTVGYEAVFRCVENIALKKGFTVEDEN